MSHVLEIDCWESLVGYRLLWDSLLLQTPRASPLQSFDVMAACWPHHPGAAELRILVVFSGPRPIGFWPLCVRQTAEHSATRRLEYLMQPWGDVCRPIGPNPTATLLAAMRHLHHRRRDWDVIDLDGIDLGGVDQGRTARAMQQVGWSPQRRSGACCPVAQLSGTWETFLESRGRGWRDRYATSSAVLRGQGKAVLTRYRPRGLRFGEGDPRWDLRDACTKLTSASSQEGGWPSSQFLYPDELHVAAACSGTLDLCLLQINNRPVAFSENLIYQGSLIQLDEGYERTDIGLAAQDVLHGRMIRDSYRRGDTRLVFAPAARDMAERLATHRETRARCIYVAAPSWRARLDRATRAFRSRDRQRPRLTV